MGALAALRFRRSLVLPFAVVAAPLLWFVGRAADRGARPGLTSGETAAGVVASLLVGYLVAVVAVATLRAGDGDLPPRLARLLDPPDRTLAAFAALFAVVLGYVALEAVARLPAWAELAVGIPTAWPLFALLVLSFAAGNAVPALQHIAVQGAAVALGVALSVAWLFLLADWLARRFSRAPRG